MKGENEELNVGCQYPEIFPRKMTAPENRSPNSVEKVKVAGVR